MQEEQQPLKAPMPNNVTLVHNPTGLTLTYRWFSRKYIFFALFCVVWTVTVFSQVSAQVSAALLKHAEWSELFFPLIFLGVGIGTLYYTIAGFVNRTCVHVTRSQIAIRHMPLPWLGNQTISATDINQLYCEEIVKHSKDGTSTHYQVSAITKNTGKIKLLSGLESSEVARFLEQEIEGWLGIKDQRVMGEMPQSIPLRTRKVPPMVGLLFAVIGTVFAVIGLGMGVRSWSFASSALRTQGTVMQMVRNSEGNSAPVVHYQLEGKTYELQGGVYSSPPAYSIGEVVTVLYRADQPSAGQISSFTDQWLLPLVFGGSGLVFAVIGFGALGTKIRDKRGGRQDAISQGNP